MIRIFNVVKKILRIFWLTLMLGFLISGAIAWYVTIVGDLH